MGIVCDNCQKPLKHRNKAALLYGEEYLLDLCGGCAYEVSDAVKTGEFAKPKVQGKK